MAEERRWAKPASGRSALLTLAVFLLVGLVAWLLAERNARHWALVVEDGLVYVKKGILFPVGRQSFRTDDPALAQAYAPLKPPPGVKLEEERSFDDRAGLDQALYELLARWARQDVATEKPENVERALGWLSRADKLANISATQREDLRNLRAESGFYEARQLLERSTELLRQARERLRLTSTSASVHAGEAGDAVRHLDLVLEEAHRASRAIAGPGGRAADGGGQASPAGGEAGTAAGAGAAPGAPAAGAAGSSAAATSASGSGAAISPSDAGSGQRGATSSGGGPAAGSSDGGPPPEGAGAAPRSADAGTP